MSRDTATPESTLQALLTRSQHDKTPVRREFLQTKDRNGAAMAEFVHRGRNLAFDLYLLILHTASVGNQKVALPGAVWARALNVAERKNSATRILRNLAWLESQRLVALDRPGQAVEVTLLREDGSEREYHHPGKKAPGAKRAEGSYLQLPANFWTDRWHRTLPLPAKAVLLIALSLSDDFYLHQERAPEWYGISADSMGRGLRSLRDHGLLKAREVTKPAPLLASGRTTELHYTLQPPFGPRGRRSGGSHDQAS